MLAERFRKREIEGFAGLRVGDEVFGRQAGLYLLAMGELGPGGRSGLDLELLVGLLARDLGHSPPRIRKLLEAHPSIEIEQQRAWWTGGAQTLP